MKLLYAPASPYARKVRVLIVEKALHGIDAIAVSPFELPHELVAANPLSKVPALILPDKTVLYDSPVICEYLDTLDTAHQMIPVSGPERWTVLRRQALTDGILDATFSIACEIGRRPAAEQSPAWIDRWCMTIKRGLGALDKEIESFGQVVNLSHIGAACALSYLDLRASKFVNWRADHLRLRDWHEHFADRPSMKATQPNA